MSDKNKGKGKQKARKPGAMIPSGSEGYEWDYRAPEIPRFSSTPVPGVAKPGTYSPAAFGTRADQALHPYKPLPVALPPNTLGGSIFGEGWGDYSNMSKPQAGGYSFPRESEGSKGYSSMGTPWTTKNIDSYSGASSPSDWASSVDEFDRLPMGSASAVLGSNSGGSFPSGGITSAQMFADQEKGFSLLDSLGWGGEQTGLGGALDKKTGGFMSGGLLNTEDTPALGGLLGGSQLKTATPAGGGINWLDVGKIGVGVFNAYNARGQAKEQKKMNAFNKIASLESRDRAKLNYNNDLATVNAARLAANSLYESPTKYMV